MNRNIVIVSRVYNNYSSNLIAISRRKRTTRSNLQSQKSCHHSITASSSSFSTNTVSSLSTPIQHHCCIQQDGGDENDSISNDKVRSSCHLRVLSLSSEQTCTHSNKANNLYCLPVNHQHHNNNNNNTKCPNHHNHQNIIPTPLPPPLPQPINSFHRRILPPFLTQLSSPQGKILFRQSLLNNYAEAFYPLSEQFLNQSDPAYCGITTLIMILNAFGIDPNVRWKGGWRWYGSEDMIIDNCCIEEERVKRAGISMEEYRSLGRCQGLDIVMKRPLSASIEQQEQPPQQQHDDDVQNNEYYTLESFRQDIKLMVQNPPPYESISSTTTTITTNNEHTSNNNNNNTNPKTKYGFIIVSFDRTSLDQTGEGHFSPIAAYHEETDQCLVLDVARFKYSPYWVKVSDLYEATRPVDSMTKKSRGWFLNYYPLTKSLRSLNGDINTDVNDNRNNGGGGGYRGTKVIDEVQRPAEVVPLVHRGLNTDVCPVGKIKREYCEVSKK